MSNPIYGLMSIDATLRELIELSESGELSQDDVSNVVARLQDGTESIVDEISSIIVNERSEITALDTEIERLKKRKESRVRFVNQLKNALQEHMSLTGERKVKTARFTVSIAKDGGKQPIKVTTEVDEIPQEFCVFTPKPNLDAIRKVLESGQKLEFARLMERGEHLIIK